MGYLPDPCELTFANTLLLSNAAVSLGGSFVSLEISSQFLPFFSLFSFIHGGHLLVCKSKNFGSWVYQLMIQFIVVSSFFLQDYISFIFSLVFFFVVFFFGVVVFLFSGHILSFTSCSLLCCLPECLPESLFRTIKSSILHHFSSLLGSLFIWFLISINLYSLGQWRHLLSLSFGAPIFIVSFFLCAIFGFWAHKRRIDRRLVSRAPVRILMLIFFSLFLEK